MTEKEENELARAVASFETYNNLLEMLADSGKKYHLKTTDLITIAAQLGAAVLCSYRMDKNEESQKEIVERFFTIVKDTIKLVEGELSELALSDNKTIISLWIIN